jgi:hypothetical protein
MTRPPPFAIDGAHRSATVLALVLCFAGTALAQQMSPPSPETIDPKRATRESQEREAGLRSAEMVTTTPTDKRGVQSAVDEVKQDFKHLQILRNQIVRHLTANGPLDYKALAGETAEINKRANRLKTRLVLYGPKDDDKEHKDEVEIGDDRMSTALVTLCKRIDSFVENPVFDLQGVVDVKQSAKAGGDLQTIIQLSAGIRRTAERLNKTPK